MTEEPAAAEETQPEHHVGAFRGLIVSLIGTVRTRFDLAAVEAEIYVLRIIQVMLWALAAVACFIIALTFGMVAVVALLWDTHRMLGVMCGGLLFLTLAAVCAFIATRLFRVRPHMLEGTLAQLETDQVRVSEAP